MRTYLTRKILWAFLIIATPTIWAASAEPDLINGVILKATLPSVSAAGGAAAGGDSADASREIYFVPSHHSTPLERFTPAFQAEIGKRQALVVESYLIPATIQDSPDALIEQLAERTRSKEDITVRLEGVEHKVTVLMLEDDSIHYIYHSHEVYEALRLFRALLPVLPRETVETMGGLLSSTDPTWSLSPEIAPKVEAIFRGVYGQAVAMGLASHCAHFLDIYQMKPGLVAAIEHEMTIDAKHANGMDRAIAKTFTDAGKPMEGVETKADVIKSVLPLPVKLEEVKDDFDLTTEHANEYWPTLLTMHKEGMKILSAHTIMGAKAVGTRNQSWKGKYAGLLAKYKDMVCVHGAAHFPGKEGLLILGQDAGWQWSIWDHITGVYKPFTYQWDAVYPFTSPDGSPLDI